MQDRCPVAPPLLIEEVWSGAIKSAGFSCSLARLRLYPRHPHRVRGTNQTKRVGQKPALFICGLSFVASPQAQTDEIKARVTELLRQIEDIVSPTVVGMGYEVVRVAMS